MRELSENGEGDSLLICHFFLIVGVIIHSLSNKSFYPVSYVFFSENKLIYVKFLHDSCEILHVFQKGP
jgi:hypothetical protein